MSSPLRAVGAALAVAVACLTSGCSSASDDATPAATADVMVEFRTVHLVSTATNKRELLPEPSEDWAQFMDGLGLPDSDDAVAAADWVATGDCSTDPVSTPEVAGACSVDGSEAFLLGPVALDASHIASAEQIDDPANGAGIVLTLDDPGAAVFEDLTSDISTLTEPRNRMAITVDGKVVTAPTVVGPIAGGVMQIAGEADDPSFTSLIDSLVD